MILTDVEQQQLKQLQEVLDADELEDFILMMASMATKQYLTSRQPDVEGSFVFQDKDELLKFVSSVMTMTKLLIFKEEYSNE